MASFEIYLPTWSDNSFGHGLTETMTIEREKAIDIAKVLSNYHNTTYVNVFYADKDTYLEKYAYKTFPLRNNPSEAELYDPDILLDYVYREEIMPAYTLYVKK